MLISDWYVCAHSTCIIKRDNGNLDVVFLEVKKRPLFVHHEVLISGLAVEYMFYQLCCLTVYNSLYPYDVLVQHLELVRDILCR